MIVWVTIERGYNIKLANAAFSSELSDIDIVRRQRTPTANKLLMLHRSSNDSPLARNQNDRQVLRKQFCRAISNSDPAGCCDGESQINILEQIAGYQAPANPTCIDALWFGCCHKMSLSSGRLDLTGIVTIVSSCVLKIIQNFIRFKPYLPPICCKLPILNRLPSCNELKRVQARKKFKVTKLGKELTRSDWAASKNLEEDEEGRRNC